MKRVIVFLAVCLIAAVVGAGCSRSKEDISSDADKNDRPDIYVFDETLDEPVKVIYQRDHMFSEVFETEDAQTISELADALNKIEILSESEMAVDDYDDCITFVDKDGSQTVVRFEFKHLLKDGKRYDINGYDRVEAVLLSFAPENSEE